MKNILCYMALFAALLTMPKPISAQLLSANKTIKAAEFLNNDRTIVEIFWKNLLKHPNVEQLKAVTASGIAFKSAIGTGFQGQNELADYVKSLENVLSKCDVQINSVDTQNEKTVVKAVISGVLKSGKPFSYNMVSWMSIRNEKIEEVVEVADIAGLTQLIGNLATLDYDRRVNDLNTELDRLMPDGVWKN